MSDTTLIQTENVQCLFTQRRGPVDMLQGKKNTIHAVDSVSLSLKEGEILALVGESGCGKSTIGRMLVKLEDPTDGKIMFMGEDVTSIRGDELKAFRQNAQIIFQNPFEAFDPRITVGASLHQVLRIHGVKDEGQRHEKIVQVMERSGLTPVDDFLARFPHQLSGGQSQRIATVRAMLLSPRFLVADEPVSMLDVSVRADILNQLLDLRDEDNMGIVFITHDLAVARYIADRIAVMYLGMFVETGDADEVVSNPRHPYSKALLSNTLPAGDADRVMEPMEIGGEVPTPVNVKPGCRFASRCPFAFDRCFSETPKLQTHGGPAEVACHLYD